MALPAMQLVVFDSELTEVPIPRSRWHTWLYLAPQVVLVALAIVAGGHVGPFHHRGVLAALVVAGCAIINAGLRIMRARLNARKGWGTHALAREVAQWEVASPLVGSGRQEEVR